MRVLLPHATKMADYSGRAEETIDGPLEIRTNAKGKAPFRDRNIVDGDGMEVLLDERRDDRLASRLGRLPDPPHEKCQDAPQGEPDHKRPRDPSSSAHC